MINKRFPLYILTLFFCLFVSAQELTDFNVERLDINKTGMMVLGGWAVANLVSSPILASRSTGSTKYFHQMNGYWNTVNFALAGFGLYGALTGDPSGFTLSETLSEQMSMEKILLFNAGLDIGYMAGGLYLLERSKRDNSDRLKGFGQSIVLQGAFLFAFDLGFFLVHQGHEQQLFKYLEQVSIHPTGFSLGWRI